MQQTQPVRVLREQPLQILRTLVEREGELVNREEIRKKLWPNDTIVEFDHSINSAIKNLRRALGDSADQPNYIETVARRGYRLLVPVEWLDIASPFARGVFRSTPTHSPPRLPCRSRSAGSCSTPSPPVSPSNHASADCAG